MEQTISIVVPVYNAKDYVGKCVSSILAQTYPHFQLILVDDGSTDGSAAICDAFAAKDPRVQVVHQTNQGVSAARNVGIAMAQGAYLTFVDADDTLAPEALETALKTMEQNDADMVTYGWCVIRENAMAENICSEQGVATDIDGVIRALLTNYADYGGGYPWNKLWRLSAFRGELPRFDRELYYFEDLEWVIRMLLKVQRIAVCPQCLYHYYIHGNSVTHSPDKVERREMGYHKSIERVIQDLSGMPKLQRWFSEKYYPEVVNGVLHAKLHGYSQLQDALIERMLKLRKCILSAPSVSGKTKLRCRCLCLLAKMRIL